MPAYLSPIGNSQIVDVNGNPLSGGKIYTYLSGTSTPASTWTTSAGTVAQTNPIILNSLGATANPIFLSAGVAYKFIIKDSTDVTTLYTFDNITGINDPAYSLLSEWVLFTNTPTYVAPTVFSVLTDQTAIFQPGRRVKTINSGGTVYSTILTSVFATGVTTVTVLNDSGVLDAGLSSVYYGFLSATSPSIPSAAQGIAQTPFRNLIFNGDFTVNQRYGVAVQTLSLPNVLFWGPDMFYAIMAGGATSTCRTLPETDGTYRFNLFGAAGVTAIKVGTRIEARNSLHLASSTATLSFKSSLSIPANVTWTAYYANSTDAFGTEGSYSRTMIATGTFAVTATEQTYSTSLNIPTGAKTGIEIVLSSGALGAGQTWKIGQIQLEKGTIPASNIGFEVVDATLQTARCQRYQIYYNEFIGTAYTSGNLYTLKLTFPVEMRAAPTFDGTPAAPAFAASTGAAGTPALFTDATIIPSNKSVVCYNPASNWTVGANIRLTAMIACNIP
jgi:hypothetical protein